MYVASGFSWKIGNLPPQGGSHWMSGDRLGGCPRDAGHLVLVARIHERREKRMGARGLRFELRMELYRQVPRMAGHFRNLDEFAVRRPSGNPQAVFGERALVEAVELVAMPMTLVDRRLAVDAVRQRPR